MTSIPVTKVNKKDHDFLNKVFCICYLIWFKKSKVQIQALINSCSKVNAITLEYTLKLGLKICFINVKAQKIDSSILETFVMALASFQVKDMLGKARFLKEMILLADFSIKVVLEILFLAFSNANIKFA